MGLNHFFLLLLCAAALTGSTVFGKDESPEVLRWTKQSLPVLQDTHTELLSPPHFSEQEEDEKKGGAGTLCGIECQSKRSPVDQSEQERILGYETMYENGTRMHTDIALKGFNHTSAGNPAHPRGRTRRKRQVYGADGRFVISDSHFITNYPFSTAVRLSTGCSGVLISPKHVLTAAHCIHNGRDYLEGVRKLRVGVLQLKTKRKGGGRRRGGRRRNERKGEEQVIEEDEGQNSIDGNVGRGRNGGKGRRRRGRKEGEEGPVDQENVGELAGGRQRKLKSLSRERRGAENRKQQPVFRWTRVKQTKIPQGWILSKSSPNSVSSDYNYALLELKRPLKQKYMQLGVAPAAAPLTRIHFSGYDTDKSLQDGLGDERVVYRFCSVSNESDDLIYQHCDAQEGATGAGVYIRLRQEVGDIERKGKWQRRVIGVFSGHQWVEVEGGGQRDFNVAVRITPAKYAQICHWIHGDPRLCEEV